MRSSGTSLLGRTAALVLLLFALVGQAWAQTSPRFFVYNGFHVIVGYQVNYSSNLPGLSEVHFNSVIKLLADGYSTETFRSIGDYGGTVSNVTAGPVENAPGGGYRFVGEVATIAVPLPSGTVEICSLYAKTDGSGVVHPAFYNPVGVSNTTTVGQSPPQPRPLRRHRFIIHNRGPGPTTYVTTFTNGTQRTDTIPTDTWVILDGEVDMMAATPGTFEYNYTRTINGPSHVATDQVPVFQTTTERYAELGGQDGYAAFFQNPAHSLYDSYTPGN